MKSLKSFLAVNWGKFFNFIQEKNTEAIILIGLLALMLTLRFVPKVSVVFSLKMIALVMGVGLVVLLGLRREFFLKLAIFFFCFIPLALCFGKLGLADKLSAAFLFSLIFGIVLVPIISSISTWWKKI